MQIAQVGSFERVFRSILPCAICVYLGLKAEGLEFGPYDLGG